jgi:hypothetical protein
MEAHFRELINNAIRVYQNNSEAARIQIDQDAEIYAHLSDKHLHHVASLLPSPNLGIVLGIPAVLPGKESCKLFKKNWCAIQDLNLRLGVKGTIRRERGKYKGDVY